MFLSEAAPPEILLYKTGKTRLHNRALCLTYLWMPQVTAHSSTQFNIHFIDRQTFAQPTTHVRDNAQ